MKSDKRFFTTLIGICAVVLVVSVAGCTSSPSVSPSPTGPSAATLNPTVAKQTQVSPTATPTPNPTRTPTNAPASTPTSTPKPQPSQASPSPSIASYTGPFVGSKNSNVYHVPWCFEAQNIKPQNLVTFPNAKAAQAAGYRPCEVCKPETTI